MQGHFVKEFSSSQQTVEYRVREARRRAKALGYSKVQTERLVALWKRRGAK